MGTIELLGLVIEIIKNAPQYGAAAQGVIAGARDIWDSIQNENAVSQVQQAEYDAALKAAHEALQNS